MTVLKRCYICRSFYDRVVKTTKGCSSEIRTWSDPHHRWYGLDVRRRIHTEAGSDRPTKDVLSDAYDGMHALASIPFDLWTLRTIGELIGGFAVLVLLNILFVVAQ